MTFKYVKAIRAGSLPRGTRQKLMNVIKAIGSIAMAKNARLTPRKTSSLGCPNVVRAEACSGERSTDGADDAATEFRVGCAIISR